MLRTRRPWLAVLANGVVLLINLNWATPDKLIFLLLFLLVSLLLLVRFTLAENIRQWKARGLRFSPDLELGLYAGGRYLCRGRVAGSVSDADWPANAATSRLGCLTAQSADLTAIQICADIRGCRWNWRRTWQASTSSIHHSGCGERTTCPSTKILHYTLPHPADDGSQYLITETYDSYDGVASWSSTMGQQRSRSRQSANARLVGRHKVDTYAITFDNVPQGGESYLFAPGAEAARFSVNTTYTTRGERTPKGRSGRRTIHCRPVTSTLRKAMSRLLPIMSSRRCRIPNLRILTLRVPSRCAAPLSAVRGVYRPVCQTDCVTGHQRHDLHVRCGGASGELSARWLYLQHDQPRPPSIRMLSPGSCRPRRASAPSSHRRWR